MENIKSKSKIGVIILLSLMLVLTGCKDKDNSSNKTNSDKSEKQKISITTTAPVTTPIVTTTKPTVIKSDFRNIKWGMTISQVKILEDSKLLDETQDGLLYSNLKVSSYDTQLIYNFEDNKLVKGSYLLNQKHSNTIDYISDYNNLKKQYINIYGKPIKDDVVWKDDLFKDDPNSYGTALFAGHLIYHAKWQTTTTDIDIILGADNFGIIFSVLYQQKGYQPKDNNDGI